MNASELQCTGLLELILNSLGEGVIVADTAGKILLFNPMAEKITGQSAENTHYEQWSETYGIFRPDGVTLFPTDENPLIRAIRGESTDEVEMFMRNPKIPNGVCLRSTGRPIRNERGEIVGGVVVFQDITDRFLSTERELQKSLSLLKATLESTADGILVVDLQGRIVSYNLRFVRMWRIPDEIMKRSDDDAALAFVMDQLVAPKDFLCKVRELYATPESESFDILDFKDGRIFERYSKPQIIGGKPVGRVWSFRDVTARRRAEEELRVAYEELKKVDQIKTNFASMISHELKTPLAAIQESVGIVLDGIDGPLEPAQRKTLDIAKVNAEWLGRLIGNFLTFTKIESGRMDLRVSSVDARKIVEEACQLMKPLAQRKGLQCLKFLPKEAVWVRWDADKMKTVVLNLFDNAVKFTEAPGSVRVRLESAGNEVTIEVEDTGIGVPVEERDSIFDMFAQAASRLPWKTGGFGIGLSICKFMVERHGGLIRLESTCGRGSRFTVKLPAEVTS
ncbi:MAG TPA: PAS domain-containing sensor histidine kinase [bacterium]|nr:PAS domain-containing sensor histidine kinase [bacterium]